MKHFITSLVRKVFSFEELIDRLEDKLNDMIDYDDIADRLLEEVDVDDIIEEIVDEEIESY